MDENPFHTPPEPCNLGNQLSESIDLATRCFLQGVIVGAISAAVIVITLMMPEKVKGNPVPKQLPPAGAIDLNGECAFGAVSQVNRAITITGGTSWEATGRVRPSGFVELRWVDLSSGRFALGLYRIVDGKTLDGHYGYEGECQYDGEDFCGAIQAEVIRIMAK